MGSTGDRHHTWDGRPKRRYATRKEAKHEMLRKNGKNARAGTLRVYRCPTCSGYHFGHDSGKEP